MKNKEFYQREIAEIAITESHLALSKGKPVSCDEISCRQCDLCIDAHSDSVSCMERFRKWAEEECVELKDNPFELQPGNIFYSIDYDGGVRWFHFDNKSGYDRQARKFGNACKDEEYMQQRAKEIRLYNLLSNFAYEVNEGWEPDWESTYQNKWYIYQSHQSHGWGVASYNQIQCMNEVYFKTKELAERAIEEVILPFERGEL